MTQAAPENREDLERLRLRNYLAERPRAGPVVPDNSPVRCPLCELALLEFQPVRRTPSEALFNSLMEQYHRSVSYL